MDSVNKRVIAVMGNTTHIFELRPQWSLLITVVSQDSHKAGQSDN